MLILTAPEIERQEIFLFYLRVNLSTILLLYYRFFFLFHVHKVYGSDRKTFLGKSVHSGKCTPIFLGYIHRDEITQGSGKATVQSTRKEKTITNNSTSRRVNNEKSTQEKKEGKKIL